LLWEEQTARRREFRIRQNCLCVWASRLLGEQVSVHKGEYFTRWVETSWVVTWLTVSSAGSCWLVLSGHFWDWCGGGKFKCTGLVLYLEVPVYCRTCLLLKYIQGNSKTVAHVAAKIAGERNVT
jgi:hypothetical protein